MPWITIADTDALPASSAERQNVAAVKGVDDLAACVARAVDAFRAAIASRGHPLDADGTVPQGYAAPVLNLALWWFVSQGVPKNEGLQTAARAGAAQAAEALLDELRLGRTVPELPAGYTPVAPRTGSWNSENKLLPRTHPTPPPNTQWQNTDNTQRPYANPEGPQDE
jgi:hypothetical protein